MLNLSSLNPQQRLAVETIKGPVLILAGAGTGKTRVITYRIAYLIERGISPGHILAVTFTNKAAREMKERVGKLLGRANRKTDPDAAKPTICTFHSLCVRILRQHIDRLGYKSNFVIYDEAEQIGAIRKILSQISAKGEKTDPKVILGFLSRYRNGGMKPGTFADESGVAMAEHIRTRYERALKACNAVDFDDLLLLTLRLFREFPDVLQTCRGRFRYVMVDEYQDTNAAQFELVQLLTQEHRNFCVVGDDDQSIYGWRGAEIANLLDLEKHYREVKVIKLEQNYRSTSVILNAANALIRNNVRRRPKQLWSQKTGDRPITLQVFPTDEEEARSLVAEIHFRHLADKVPWRDQAILFRTNQQSRPFEIALRQAGVPYRLVGGQSYFDRREVRDVLAYFKVLLNPHDDVSLLRIANVPPRGLSDTTMERLLASSHERQCSVFSVMVNPGLPGDLPRQASESIRAFIDLINAGAHPLGTQHAGGAFSLAAWAEKFFEHIGYFHELRRGEKDPEAGESRVRNVRDLLTTLDEETDFAQTPRNRLERFLEELMLDQERAEEDESEKDAVTLITIHSCKGLEFRQVYIAGVEDGLVPHTRSKEEGTVDEERRLFYVAITRAMEQLTLSYCLGRKRYGAVTPCHPSPFLAELPPELLERADTNRKPVAVQSGKHFFDVIRNSIG